MFEDCKVELLESFGSDLTVVNAARVSLHKHSDYFEERDEKLIKYLVKHNHESPFFHPQVRFRIKMPIWMAREWYRHTIGFARNEVSRRYVDNEPTFHIPSGLRLRAPNKKQGSLDEIHPENTQLINAFKESCYKSVAMYNLLLGQKVAPEQARMVLPQNMMTEFIETGSLAAYARLYRLRTSPDAQEEIRKVAEMIGEKMLILFPVSWRELVNRSWEESPPQPLVEVPQISLPEGSYFQG